MPKVAPIISNFGTGEVSSLFYGRVDAERYKTAVATCLNYFPTMQGSLLRRSGTAFVAEAIDSSKKSRLQAFEFSTTQSYMIEFSEAGLRFYKDNGAILETAAVITGATQASPTVITAVAHGYCNGDDVEINSITGMTQLNGRRFRIKNKTANTFELTQVNGGANIDSTAYTAYSANGTVARVYTKPTRVITGITAANPGVVNSAAHGFANGDQVWIKGVVGMTEVNSRFFTVAGATADTFQLSGTNTTGYTAYSSGGTAGVTPYLESELFQVKCTQSADVLYIVHPNYPPAKLTRTGHTAWTFVNVPFVDGPYLLQNIRNDGSQDTTTTITNSAAAGANITLTASAALWNFPTPYTGDVGRLVRMKVGASVWGYARIIADAGNTSTVAHADVLSTFSTTAATTAWRLGVWSTTTGFPGTVVFHQSRLHFAGSTSFPQRFDSSNTDDFENFKDTNLAATPAPTESNAYFYTLNANDVNAIRWVTSDEKGFLCGTTSGEWVIKNGTPISTAQSTRDISIKRASSYGSANVQPVQVGKSTLFVQRAGKKIRELLYFYDVDGFQANDMTLLGEHITGAGVTQMCFQKEPISLIWAVRSDGVLASMTYERDLESIRAGWSRHILGGVSDAASNNTYVESIAAIPSPDGTRDEAWVMAKRYINGKTYRYIEYITKVFDDLDKQRDANFLDCSLKYDTPFAINSATQTNPVVLNVTAHGFSNGDQILVSDVYGMTALNTETFTIANVTANTFELQGIDGTSYPAYVSGGYVRKYVSTITGLWHLIGQSVSILGDGAVQPNQTVSSLGSITLQTHATTVRIGLSYNSDGQLLRFDAGSANGTSIGKTRRTHLIGMMLHRTLGLKIGFNFSALDEYTFRASSDPMSRAPGLFTGIISENVDSDYDFENQFCWRQSQPLPGLIQAVMPQMETQDRG